METWKKTKQGSINEQGKMKISNGKKL